MEKNNTHTALSKSPFCVMVVLFALAGSAVFAGQTDPNDTDTLFDKSLEELMDMQISTGSNLRGLTARDIPGSVYTITAADIRQTGARHLGEALMILVPGFMWTVDEDDYIFAFRGLIQDNNSSVALLVNGQDVGYHYNYGLASQMASLDLNHIERVDIIIGPGGADNGAGPLMATIDVTTTGFHKPESYLKSGVQTGTGNYQDYFGSVHYDKGGDFKFDLTTAFYQQRKGFSAKTGDAQWTVPDGTTGGGGVRSSGRYLQIPPGQNYYGRAEYKDYQFSFFHTDQYFDPYEKDTDVFQHYITDGLKVEKDYTITDEFSIDVQGWYKRIGAWVRNSIGDPSLGWDIQEGEVNFGGKLTGQYNAGPFKTAMGVRFNQNDYGKNPYTGNNQQRMIAGNPIIYDLQGNPYSLPADSMTPSAGNFSINDYDLFGEVHYALTENQRFLFSGVYSHVDARNDNSFSPRIAYFGKSGNYNWKLFYTKAFKSVMDASYTGLAPGAFFRHYTTSDLKQQAIQDFEANISYSKGNFFWELRSFYSMNKNVIQGGGADLALSDPVEASKYWWTFVNAGQVNLWGAEAILKTDITPELTFMASHALVRVSKLDIDIDKDLFVSSSQKKFLNYPEDVTRLHLIYNPKKVPGLTLRSDFLIDYGRLQGDPLFSDAAPANNLESENWYNLNLGAIYDYKNWEFDFHLYNVLNSRPYQPTIFRNQYAAMPTPFSWTFGVAYKLNF